MTLPAYSIGTLTARAINNHAVTSNIYYVFSGFVHWTLQGLLLVYCSVCIKIIHFDMSISFCTE
jgi:hypothetical protein